MKITIFGFFLILFSSYNIYTEFYQPTLVGNSVIQYWTTEPKPSNINPIYFVGILFGLLFCIRGSILLFRKIFGNSGETSQERE
jgi:hypothetical protein